MTDQNSKREWVCLIPVKSFGAGKSRLRIPPEYASPTVTHDEIVYAIVIDTVRAVLAESLGPTIVVTADPDVHAAVSAAGADVFTESGSGGLLGSLDEAVAARPDRRIAVLLGDLPDLRPGDLTAVLSQVGAGERGFVRDAAGTGTTLLAADGVAVDPRFGPDSALRHQTSGARELSAPDTVRHDVDTFADLLAAPGPLSAAVLRRLRSQPFVAATVAAVSERGGSVLTDAGELVDFDARVVDPHLRSLRVGQRVRIIRPSGAGRITDLRFATDLD